MHFYGLPNNSCENIPLPHVFVSITYETAGFRPNILSPRRWRHHNMNIADLVTKLSQYHVDSGVRIISLHVTALYTRLSVKDSIRIINKRLERERKKCISPFYELLPDHNVLDTPADREPTWDILLALLLLIILWKSGRKSKDHLLIEWSSGRRTSKPEGSDQHFRQPQESTYLKALRALPTPHLEDRRRGSSTSKVSQNQSPLHFRKNGSTVFAKPCKTICSRLVAPKYKTDGLDKSGASYNIECHDMTKFMWEKREENWN